MKNPEFEALKKYNLEALQKFQDRKVQEALCYLDEPTSNPGAEPEDQPPQMNTDHDLKTPDDSILDCINSQAPNDEQMEQALQTYQAMTSQTNHSVPNRSINTHITYHVDKVLQSKHASLVDRGANGGLVGSDVRILSKSPRQCNVTSIHNHVKQDLDIVQCTALVNANHGIVNLIMNEYAYSGQGHTIHSPGQIE